MGWSGYLKGRCYQILHNTMSSSSDEESGFEYSMSEGSFSVDLARFAARYCFVCRTAEAEEIFASVLDLVTHLSGMSPDERVAFMHSPDIHLIKVTLQNCRRDCDSGEPPKKRQVSICCELRVFS